MLVSDRIERKIYSYSIETKERQDSNATTDVFVLNFVFSESENTNLVEVLPYGIWSDGTTLWIAYNAYDPKYPTNEINSKIYAYEMTWVTNSAKRYLMGSRDSGKDIDLDIEEDQTLSFLDYGRQSKPALVMGEKR